MPKNKSEVTRLILEALRGGSSSCNCYIVGSEETGEGMVIDPGVNARLILGAAQRLGLSLSTIVVTHAHWDHLAALARVKQQAQAEFLLHEAERMRWVTRAMSSIRSAVLTGSLGMLPRPDRLLHDGDIINVGNLTFTVLHTPGHSAGGICLLGEGVVFSGDTLFRNRLGRVNNLAGRMHLPVLKVNYSRLLESIVAKLMTLPDETRVLPGHGRETTIGFERRHNPSLRKWQEQQKTNQGETKCW